MTKDVAILCLPAKAKLLSSDPEGDLYKAGKDLWMIHEDVTGWNCTKINTMINY